MSVSVSQPLESDRELDVALLAPSVQKSERAARWAKSAPQGLTLPTMFWILKSVNLVSKPSFWMMRAYFRAASRESSSDLAPVTTTLPEANTSAVVLGSRIRMMTAANRYSSGARGKAQNRVQSRVLKRLEGRTRGARLTFGLYSALRACNAIVLRSSLHSRLTVATKFLQGVFRKGQMQLGVNTVCLGKECVRVLLLAICA